ncbi:hypothetical protein [Cytobacillus firmus]|uniref:hypothetical protein n=1 Tax=Cytobacillus firmus TaxID=1399 RepID=UPI002228517D|nr:hypothetical protein [Cytobacillus firmus]
MKALLLSIFIVFSFAMIAGCQSAPAEKMVLLDEEIREIKFQNQRGLGKLTKISFFFSMTGNPSLHLKRQ